MDSHKSVQFGANLANIGNFLVCVVVLYFTVYPPHQRSSDPPSGERAVVEARYNLELRQQVENMRDRLALENASDGALLMPIQGRDARKNLRVIASKLWEAAYSLVEKRNGL